MAVEIANDHIGMYSPGNLGYQNWNCLVCGL